MITLRLMQNNLSGQELELIDQLNDGEFPKNVMILGSEYAVSNFQSRSFHNRVREYQIEFVRLNKIKRG